MEWEYGAKPDLRMSHFDGNLENALEAIEDGGFSEAVVTNLFKAGRLLPFHVPWCKLRTAGPRETQRQRWIFLDMEE